MYVFCSRSEMSNSQGRECMRPVRFDRRSDPLIRATRHTVSIGGKRKPSSFSSIALHLRIRDAYAPRVNCHFFHGFDFSDGFRKCADRTLSPLCIHLCLYLYCRVNPVKFAFRITNGSLRSDRSVLSYGAVETYACFEAIGNVYARTTFTQ